MDKDNTNNENSLEEWKKIAEENKKLQNHICPNCGYCPCCGRPYGNWNFPHYPTYPYWAAYC